MPSINSANIESASIDSAGADSARISAASKKTSQAKIIPYAPTLSLGEFVCAIGVFDGIHKGHQYIIAKTIEQAKRLGLPAIAVTFDRDPDELFLEPVKQRKLLTNEDRIALLRVSGVDSVLVIPFEPTIVQSTPQEFLDVVIWAHGKPRGIHVGADFRFGHKAAGSVSDLELWGASRSCEIHAHTLFADEYGFITATRIRNALQAGDLVQANNLLGRPYYLWARVVTGRSVGKELGFPTANLELEVRLVCPADGVYAGAVVIEGKLYKAAISVGEPVTFANAPATIEAHILDYNGDLYGEKIKTHFFAYLRPMMAFKTVEELKQTVQKNIEQVRACPIPSVLA